MTVYDHETNGQAPTGTRTQNIFRRLKDDLLPPADRAFAALIEDLTERGLLDSTLVVALGEFGRTPKINGQAGRDHWPHCYSAVLAGGGVRGGTVLRGQRQDRRLSRPRRRHARRPRRDPVLAVRPRPHDRGPRPDRPALSTGGRSAAPRGLFEG